MLVMMTTVGLRGCELVSVSEWIDGCGMSYRAGFKGNTWQCSCFPSQRADSTSQYSGNARERGKLLCLQYHISQVVTTLGLYFMNRVGVSNVTTPVGFVVWLFPVTHAEHDLRSTCQRPRSVVGLDHHPSVVVAPSAVPMYSRIPGNILLHSSGAIIVFAPRPLQS